jgi:hypothetical protein
MTRICNLCNKIKPLLGGKLLRVFGLRSWVCTPCHAKAMQGKSNE